MYYIQKGMSVAHYNRVVMIGNLTRDPEHKQLTSGQSVCRLGLASNRQYKNRQTGAMVQEVCFVDIDVFGPQADSCNQYLQKGRQVLVEGRLKLDTWETPEGNNRSKHSIIADRVVFLSSPSADTDSVASGQELSNDPQVQAAQSAVKKAVARQANAEKQEDSADQGSDGEFAFKDEPPFQDDLPF